MARRRGPVAVGLSLNNLRKHLLLNENDIKEEVVRSGGVTNWRVNFSEQKSRAACVVERKSLPDYLLKRIDVCKLRFVTQSQ